LNEYKLKNDTLQSKCDELRDYIEMREIEHTKILKYEEKLAKDTADWVAKRESRMLLPHNVGMSRYICRSFPFTP